MRPDGTTRELLLLKQHYNVRDDDPIFAFLHGYGKLQERMFHNIHGAEKLASTLSSDSRTLGEKSDELIAATENLAQLGEKLSDAETFYTTYQNDANAMLLKQQEALEKLDNFDTSLMQLVIKDQMEKIGQKFINQTEETGQKLIHKMNLALRQSMQENEKLKKKITIVKVAAISSGLTAVAVAGLMLAALK